MERAFASSKNVKSLPVVHVDLSLSAANGRWAALSELEEFDLPTLVRETQEYVDEMCSSAGFPDRKSWTGRCFFFVVFLFASIVSYFFQYRDDIVELAKVLNLHVGELFIANVLHEILGGCTSFVCHDKDDPLRRPIHGRTLGNPLSVCLDRFLCSHAFNFYQTGPQIIWVKQQSILFGCEKETFASSQLVGRVMLVSLLV